MWVNISGFFCSVSVALPEEASTSLRSRLRSWEASFDKDVQGRQFRGAEMTTAISTRKVEAKNICLDDLRGLNESDDGANK